VTPSLCGSVGFPLDRTWPARPEVFGWPAPGRGRSRLLAGGIQPLRGPYSPEDLSALPLAIDWVSIAQTVSGPVTRLTGCDLEGYLQNLIHWLTPEILRPNCLHKQPERYRANWRLIVWDTDEPKPRIQGSHESAIVLQANQAKNFPRSFGVARNRRPQTGVIGQYYTKYPKRGAGISGTEREGSLVN